MPKYFLTIARLASWISPVSGYPFAHVTRLAIHKRNVRNWNLAFHECVFNSAVGSLLFFNIVF